jgi:hypothetical protein
MNSSRQPALAAAPDSETLDKEPAPPLKTAIVDQVFSSTVGEDQALALSRSTQKRTFAHGTQAGLAREHELLLEPVGGQQPEVGW